MRKNLGVCLVVPIEKVNMRIFSEQINVHTLRPFGRYSHSGGDCLRAPNPAAVAPRLSTDMSGSLLHRSLRICLLRDRGAHRLLEAQELRLEDDVVGRDLPDPEEVRDLDASFSFIDSTRNWMPMDRIPTFARNGRMWYNVFCLAGLNLKNNPWWWMVSGVGVTTAGNYETKL